MTRLATNVIANYVGRGWTILLGVALVPLYLHFMGIEAYGLVGVFLTLQSLIAFADFGLGTAANRQLALHGADPQRTIEVRDLLRTLEAFYWVLAVALAVVVAFLGPLLVQGWTTTSTLGAPTIARAVLLLGIAAAFQIPSVLYSASLLGLERQVAFNAFLVGATTARGLGAVLILWKVSATPEAFFLWQVIVTIAQAAVGSWLVWRAMPRGDRPPRIALRQVGDVWRFAAGVSIVTVLGALLASTDKLVLTRVIDLRSFGHYTLAGVVATGVYSLATPIYMSVFPRLSRLASSGDLVGARALYRRACQIFGVTLVPVAVVIAVFAEDVVRLWTHDAGVAHEVAPLVALLVLSYVVVAVAGLATTLQLARGRTRSLVLAAAAALLVAGPTFVVVSLRWGALGAAATWLVLSIANTTTIAFLTHWGSGRTGVAAAYGRDLGVPLLAASAVAFSAKLLLPAALDGFRLAAFLAVIGALTLAACVVTVPAAWASIRSLFSRRAFI